MGFVRQQITRVWSFLLRPLLLWVVTKASPESPKQRLNLTDGPIIYLLPRKYYTDRLVLMQVCKKYKLPLPEYNLEIKDGNPAICVFLDDPKMVIPASKNDWQIHSQLRAIVRRWANAVQFREYKGSLQIVPVSPFWGKNPGREERSVLNLLFSDDDRAGWLRRLFIVLFQGRNNTVYFSKPYTLSPDQHIDVSSDLDREVYRIVRLMRFHFRRLRHAVLGRKLYDREQLIRRVALGRLVREEIEREANLKKTTVRNLETKARRYAREVAADQTYSMVRLFEILLGKLWNKLFDGVEAINVDKVSALAQQNFEIVYVPTHRSHLDYLLTSYTVYESGLPSPHIAAGINLNFWPIGWFLRRAGAFYIRRTFRGNRLYSAVVNEYIHYLLSEGYPITFFPEGGRSRTGRLLNFKTGMLSMVVQSYLRNSEKPVALVPVYLGYDKVMEVGSYLKELSGKGKKKESFSQLLAARKLLRAYYGKAYVSYGEPILLSKFLDRFQPDWKNLRSLEKPNWLPLAVNHLAEELAISVNQAAVLSPVSLVGLGLLSAWQKALPRSELASFIDLILALNQKCPFHPNVSMPLTDPEKIIDVANQLQVFSTFKFSGGDVLHLDALESTVISYYRNNVAHVVAIPSLIARFFKYQESVSLDDLKVGCKELYPFLRDEYFLVWSDDEVEALVERYASALCELGLLIRGDSDHYQRARPGFDHFENLNLLGNALGLTFERYTLTAALLAKHADHGYVLESEFEHQCRNMTQRLAILNGVNNTEFVEKSFVQKHIQLLKKRGLLRPDDKGRLLIDSRVSSLAKSSRKLLSYDARYSIDRIFSHSISK